MIKTLLIAGLLSTTALANTASASVDHCGVNESRFNPSSLSDYQECWLDVHRGDDTSGVMGSVFWVHINDKYYSAAISTLRWDMGEAFKQMIVDDQVSMAQMGAIDAAIEDLQDRIATADELRDVMMEQADSADALRSIIEQHEAVVAALEAEIAMLEELLAAPEYSKEDLVAEYNRGFEDGKKDVMDNDPKYDNDPKDGSESEGFAKGQQDVKDNDPKYDNDPKDGSDAQGRMDLQSELEASVAAEMWDDNPVLRSAYEAGYLIGVLDTKAMDMWNNAEDVVTTHNTVTGLDITKSGHEVTVAVNPNYTLMLTADLPVDADATVNDLDGITETVYGNAVTIAVSAGYQLLADADVPTDAPATWNNIPGLTITGSGNVVTIAIDSDYSLVLTSSLTSSDAVVNDLDGITETVSGTNVTIAVSDGYQLLTDAQVNAKDLDATVNDLTGITETVSGNAVTIAVASGYQLLTDAAVTAKVTQGEGNILTLVNGVDGIDGATKSNVVSKINAIKGGALTYTMTDTQILAGSEFSVANGFDEAMIAAIDEALDDHADESDEWKKGYGVGYKEGQDDLFSSLLNPANS